MMPAQFQVDLFDELRTLVGGYEPLVLKRVMDELEGISRERGQTGAAARLGLTIGRKCTVADGQNLKPGSVDQQVVEYAVRNGCLVVTNDRRLRDELCSRGIGVISMRKQKRLELLRR
jgi:rRNA-processing protein FCF1